MPVEDCPLLSNTPVVVTEYILARLLKSYGASLGLHDHMAEATSQVHLQQAGALLKNWTSFFQNCCAGCAHDPQTCTQLNPNPLQVQPGQSIHHVRAAVSQMIETGRMRTCPLREAR